MKIEDVIDEVKQTIEILEEVKERGDCGCDVEIQIESEKIKLDALEKQIPLKPTRHSDCITCGNCWGQIKTVWKSCPNCMKLIDWSVEE